MNSFEELTGLIGLQVHCMTHQIFQKRRNLLPAPMLPGEFSFPVKPAKRTSQNGILSSAMRALIGAEDCSFFLGTSSSTSRNSRMLIQALQETQPFFGACFEILTRAGFESKPLQLPYIDIVYICFHGVLFILRILRWESNARIEIAIHFQHSSGQLNSPADSKLTSSAVSSDPSGDFHHGSSIRMATFRWDQTSKKWCFSAVVAGLQLHQHFVPPVSSHGKMMDLGSGWRWEVTHEYLTSWGNAASQSISIDVNI